MYRQPPEAAKSLIEQHLQTLLLNAAMQMIVGMPAQIT